MYADRIAPWKTESRIESILGKLADRSFAGRKLYCSYYKKTNPGYYEKGLAMISRQLEDFGWRGTDESREKIICDMVYSLHRFGCMFDEYFLYDFNLLNAKGRSAFVTDKNRWAIYEQLNDESSLKYFDNKMSTYEMFREYYGREAIAVGAGKEDDVEELIAFANAHSSAIVKPMMGSGGKGVFLADFSADGVDRAVRKILAATPCVVEEVIVQVPKMAALHPSSLNTVRLPTIRLASGDICFFHPFLRMGRGGSVVDNAASGGIFSVVDPESGIVYMDGVDEHGGRYIIHPDTHVAIPGFSIPRWEEAKELAKKLSEKIPSCRYVGWDLALTKRGWVMVEGNPNGQLVMQMVTKQGLKQEFEQLAKRAS